MQKERRGKGYQTWRLRLIELEGILGGLEGSISSSTLKRLTRDLLNLEYRLIEDAFGHKSMRNATYSRENLDLIIKDFLS